MYENKALDPGGGSSSARMKPHVSGMHLSIDDDVSDYGRVEPGSAGGRLLRSARTGTYVHIANVPAESRSRVFFSSSYAAFLRPR